MNNIPSLDLRDFLSEDTKRKEEFVQSIGRAFQEIGFCAVKGHLLSDDLVERLYKQIKLFFDHVEDFIDDEVPVDAHENSELEGFAARHRHE